LSLPASPSPLPDPSPRPTPAWQGLGAVFLGSTILGLSAIFVKWAVAGGASPVAVGAYRLLFALPGTYLLARSESRQARLRGQGTGWLWAILAGAFFFFDVWMWHAAMGMTSAANATFIVGGLCPIWVALFSVLIRGQRYRWLGWLGQGLGLAGALILAMARGARVGDGHGEALSLLASFCYAGFTLSLGNSRRTLQAGQALFWFSLSSCVCFLLGSLATGAPLAGFDSRAWLSLVGLGLVVHVLAWRLNSWGLGHVETAFGALGLQAQQVATLFLGAWLLSEPVRPLGLVGGILIMSGIVAVAFGPGRTSN
jgi:drug/metabolite transporter (DMT)-like permease